MTKPTRVCSARKARVKLRTEAPPTYLTTLSNVVGVIEMVRDDKLPNSGILKQKGIPLADIVTTPKD